MDYYHRRGKLCRSWHSPNLADEDEARQGKARCSTARPLNHMGRCYGIQRNRHKTVVGKYGGLAKSVILALSLVIYSQARSNERGQPVMDEIL